MTIEAHVVSVLAAEEADADLRVVDIGPIPNAELASCVEQLLDADTVLQVVLLLQMMVMNYHQVLTGLDTGYRPNHWVLACTSETDRSLAAPVGPLPCEKVRAAVLETLGAETWFGLVNGVKSLVSRYAAVIGTSEAGG